MIGFQARWQLVGQRALSCNLIDEGRFRRACRFARCRRWYQSEMDLNVPKPFCHQAIAQPYSVKLAEEKGQG